MVILLMIPLCKAKQNWEPKTKTKLGTKNKKWELALVLVFFGLWGCGWYVFIHSFQGLGLCQ